MNKVESSAMGLLAGMLMMVATWSIWTFWVFELLMEIAPHFGLYLETVEHEFYWLMVGIWLLWSLKSANRIYHYARRGDKA